MRWWDTVQEVQFLLFMVQFQISSSVNAVNLQVEGTFPVCITDCYLCGSFVFMITRAGKLCTEQCRGIGWRCRDRGGSSNGSGVGPGGGRISGTSACHIWLTFPGLIHGHRSTWNAVVAESYKHCIPLSLKVFPPAKFPCKLHLKPWRRCCISVGELRSYWIESLFKGHPLKFYKSIFQAGEVFHGFMHSIGFLTLGLENVKNPPIT